MSSISATSVIGLGTTERATAGHACTGGVLSSVTFAPRDVRGGAGVVTLRRRDGPHALLTAAGSQRRPLRVDTDASRAPLGNLHRLDLGPGPGPAAEVRGGVSGDNHDPWADQNSFEVEHVLRSSLREVGLVAELDLSLEGDLYGQARSVFARCYRLWNWERICPSAIVVFLVAEGVHRYEGGTFWPNISVGGIDGPNEQSRVGKAFRLALRTLGLETFQHVLTAERALRNVTPILLHGGIPAYCASDVWELLLADMRDGADDAGIPWRWKARGYPGLDKPVQRFLAYGGLFAENLIARMWQFAEVVSEIGLETARGRGAEELAHDAGLPRYLVESFLEGGHKPVRRGPRLPRPRVLIDRYAGAGPYVELPPAPGCQGSWIVTDGRGRSRSFAVSRYDLREVPLDPPCSWEVMLRTSTRARAWRFEGLLEAPTCFFAEGGELVRNQESLRGTSILALAPIATEFLGADEPSTVVPEAEDLPPLTGDWSGWRLRALNLGDRDCVIVVCPAQPLANQEAIQRRLHVASSLRRCRIVSEPLCGVTDSGGRPVYPYPPRLSVELGDSSLDSWRARYRADSVQRTESLAVLADGEGTFDTSRLLPERLASFGSIEIFGPLGSDFREELAVVSGLTVPIPERVIDPEEHIQLVVAADVPLDSHGRTRIELAYPPGCDTQSIQVDPGAGGAELRISIPRLLWTVRRTDSFHAPFGCEHVRFGIDDLEGGAVEAICVRLRRREQVSLELATSQGAVQATDPTWTSGSEGRWSFPLGQFRDTALGTGVDRLRFTLRVGDLAVRVATIEATYEVSNLRCSSIVDTAERASYFAVRWTENRRFRDREIRLWSLHRLWEPPICETVGDAAAGAWDFLCETDLPAGPYLLELSIRDPWAPPPTCPTSGLENVVVVDLGTYEDASDHLNGLDPSRPLHALELEVAERGPVSEFNGAAAEGVHEELSRSLDALCGSRSLAAVRQRLLDLELAHPNLIAERLSEDPLNESEGFRRHVLLLLAGITESSRRNLEDELLERLWRTSPLVAAAFDSISEFSAEVSGRWERWTGWNPLEPTDGDGGDRSLYPGGAIAAPLHEWPPERLRELQSAIPASRSGRLLFSGFLAAMTEFLGFIWPHRRAVTDWRSRFGGFFGANHWMSDSQRKILAGLDPADDMPAWCRFPGDLQAAAFHLIGFPPRADEASDALAVALRFAPELTIRCVLVAIAILRRGGDSATGNDRS